MKYMESLEAQTDKHGAFDLLYEVKYAANFMAVTPLLEMMCLWMMHKVNDMKTGEDVSIV